MPAKKTTPKAEVEALRAEIRKHDRFYYLFDNPTISDSEYDALMSRLKLLETQHPELVNAGSPTQRVSGTPSSTFKSVHHAVPMLSIENAFTEESIRAWDERVHKNLPPNERPVYTIEPKVDGLSCSLTYTDGALTMGATRGDGDSGEDVTANVRMINNVPLGLIGKRLPSRVDIRGEVYMTFRDFDRINSKQRELGEEPFANPRNCAAGSLRQKNPKITKERRLKFIAHSYGAWEGSDEPQSHNEFLGLCQQFGLDSNFTYLQQVASIEKVISYWSEFKTLTNSKLPFAIDGLVVKVNSFAHQKRLGFTAKTPRWAIAFKYQSEQATSIVESVIFSVGRTGAITPVAKVTPVPCAGVTISSITLHNFDEIARLGLQIGDRVLIERAGEVIPKIIKVTERARNGKPIPPPKKCPDCASPVTKDAELVAYYCGNPNCPAQLRRSLEHFASRSAMDIVGLGDSAIDQLVTKGLVNDVADIYKLRMNDLLNLELFAEKKAENLLAQIESSKAKPLDRLINALGIRHIGDKTAETVAERFDISQLLNANESDFQSIPDIGPIVAKSLYAFFSSESGRRLIAELRGYGLKMPKPERVIAAGAPFAGMTFVFTGALTQFTRDEAEEKVKALGGKASGSVSAKTTYVVYGEDAGSKLKKAGELGVKTITEAEFARMLP